MTPIIPVIIMFLELLLVLELLVLADRWLHRSLQGVMLLFAQDEEIALWLYAILLIPGVALHELSHAVVAAALGVRIGRIHILPRRVGQRIQLGFVPVEQTDVLRASLIGAAPLLCGGLAVVLMGYWRFGTPDVLAALAAEKWLLALLGLVDAFKTPDAWLWAYLIFTVGNTMLPSPSDIHAWPLLATLLAGLALIVVVAGGGIFLLNGIGTFLTMTVRWIVLLGGCTLLIDLPFFAVILMTIKLLERFRGVRSQ